MSVLSRCAIVRALSLLSLAWALCAGAAPLRPTQPDARAASDALALREHQAAQQAAEHAGGARLWFAGFAMNATSAAFSGDIARVADVAGAIPGTVLRYEHVNPVAAGPLRHPFATPRTLALTLQRIGAQTRPGDIVLLVISTHGGKGLLSINAGGREYPPFGSAALARALQPLGDVPTVVVLSACYSGSFIPALARSNRIVLTAASAQRSSYGCDASSKETFFVEESFDSRFDAGESLRQLFARSRAQIAQREHEAGLRPSDPQLSVGAGVTGLAERPMRDWLQP